MKVSIVIPVFNEEETVSLLLNKVSKSILPKDTTKEIIVVDDGSTDQTNSILKRLKIDFKLISHPKNYGKGAAIRTGLSKATGDLILIQDADLEYDPVQFKSLLQPFSNPKIKAVYGSRLMNYPLKLWGKDKTPLPFHLIANKFLTLLTNILFKSDLTDMETCYKIIDTKLMQSFHIKSNRFDIEPEITAKILKRGIPIVEVPIKVSPRSYADGKKITWQDGFVAIWTLFKYKLTD